MTPSTGTAFSQCQFHGRSPNTGGTKRTAITNPPQRNNADPLVRERIQVQPRPPSHKGRKKAVRPMDWSRKSLKYAPNRPIQLRAVFCTAHPEAVLNEGSVGWYVAKARKRRTETRANTKPM